MEYLQDASKRKQRQFYKRWTANRQSLQAERCYAVCLTGIIFERLARLVNTVNVKYAILQHLKTLYAIATSSMDINRSSTNCELLNLIFNTHEKNDVIKCE